MIHTTQQTHTTMYFCVSITIYLHVPSCKLLRNLNQCKGLFNELVCVCPWLFSDTMGILVQSPFCLLASRNKSGLIIIGGKILNESALSHLIDMFYRPTQGHMSFWAFYRDHKLVFWLSTRVRFSKPTVGVWHCFTIEVCSTATTMCVTHFNKICPQT